MRKRRILELEQENRELEASLITLRLSYDQMIEACNEDFYNQLLEIEFLKRILSENGIDFPADEEHAF